MTTVSVTEHNSSTGITTRQYKSLGGRMLLDWFTIEIETVPLPEDKWDYIPGSRPLHLQKATKNVYFCSRLHVNKRVKLTFSFSDEFTDSDILHDSNVMSKFLQMYGHDNWV